VNGKCTNVHRILKKILVFLHHSKDNICKDIELKILKNEILILESFIINGDDRNILVVIEHRIWGNCRFLSHSETMRLFQYAAVRAEIDIRYSGGFNPRPRLSLPLPRPVGIEADNDLLCIRIVAEEPSSLDIETIMSKLRLQIPAGCELISGRRAESFPVPQQATYYFAIKQCVFQDQIFREKLEGSAERLMARDIIILQRQQDSKGFRTKDIDVRPYLDSIKFDDNGIAVECIINPCGTIRVEEVIKLIGIDAEILARPVRRTHIKWRFDRLNKEQDILEDTIDVQRDVN